MNVVANYDYRNRVYSASLGRFLQTDPIRFEAGDGNLYRYVENNACNEYDPYGLWAWLGRQALKKSVKPGSGELGGPNFGPYCVYVSEKENFNSTGCCVNKTCKFRCTFGHLGDEIGSWYDEETTSPCIGPCSPPPIPFGDGAQRTYPGPARG